MIIKIGKIILVICVFFLCAQPVYADKIYLRNNDKITGEIVKKSGSAILIKTEAMGVVSVRRDFIDHVTKEERVIAKEKEEEIEIVTNGEISLGYNANRGNSETHSIYARTFFNRNRKHIDEWTLKGDLHYSEVNREIIPRSGMEWDGMRLVLAQEKHGITSIDVKLITIDLPISMLELFQQEESVIGSLTSRSSSYWQKQHWAWNAQISEMIPGILIQQF